MVNKEILELLKQENILNESQIAEAEKKAQAEGQNIEDILIKDKLVDSEKLVEVKAKFRGMPYVNLMERDVAKDVLNIISPEVAKNYRVICFNKEKNQIDVGILDAGNFKAVEAINFLANEEGYRVKYYLMSEDSFNKSLKQYQTLSEEVEVALKAQEEEAESERTSQDKQRKTEEVTKAAPVSKIVSVILKHAVEGGASDIHIEPFKKESRIRYRIDGILNTSLVLPISVHGSIVARIKVLANLKLDETRVPQDGRIRVNFGKKRIDFRVSVLPLVETEKVVMRILDVSRGAPTLEDLGYEGHNLKIITSNIKQTDGLFLVTGPTGSGKSTTLFSAMTLINKEGVNISTLEDPVEYFLDGANQSQIRDEVGFTFATGLRALLRQDPDIIMVGEIRDSETAELAIHAALTGHMVLSTIHTNDAIGTIPRLIDMKVEPFLLASTLNGILAQRLVRRVCTYCKIEHEMSEEVRNTIRTEVDKMYELVDDKTKKLFDDTILNKGKKGGKLYKGKGCARCGGSGYKGRVSIAEVLDVNDDIRGIIANGKELNHNSEILKKQKFITVQQDGIIRVLQGVTSMEEVLRVMGG